MMRGRGKKVQWIQNSRICRYAKELLGTTGSLGFIASKLVHLVVPVDLLDEWITITIPATAGNVITSIRVPKGHQLEVLYGRISLTCDATVATRTIRQRIVGAGLVNVLTQFLKGADCTASNSTASSYNNETGIIAGAQLSDAAHHGNCPYAVKGDDVLQVYVAAGVAGDSYSGFLKVRFR